MTTLRRASSYEPVERRLPDHEAKPECARDEGDGGDDAPGDHVVQGTKNARTEQCNQDDHRIGDQVCDAEDGLRSLRYPVGGCEPERGDDRQQLLPVPDPGLLVPPSGSDSPKGTEQDDDQQNRRHIENLSGVGNTPSGINSERVALPQQDSCQDDERPDAEEREFRLLADEDRPNGENRQQGCQANDDLGRPLNIEHRYLQG
jgi:hypothetical protein